jgi:putative flavoprotein involved in K+ transport
MGDGQVGTAVIGGSQAGLAVGYHLKQRGLSFLILDRHARVGGAWRARWDSLRLFTPARLSALPGMRFPGPPGAFPTKDQMADYLEAYAKKFELPVRTGAAVDSVSKVGNRFAVRSGEKTLWADNVIVATGAYQKPWVPPFAVELDPQIAQLHSLHYRNPSQVDEGPVLVVGVGNSGAEIAMDLARGHQTWLSGRDTGHEPGRPESLVGRLVTPLIWFMATRVLKVTNPLGRKARDHFLHPPRGIPLGRVRRGDFARVGIQRVSRVAGVKDGRPLLEDGRALEVSSVVWCTGFTPSLGWLDLPLAARDGYPDQRRGIVDAIPGLYFLGLPFLYTLSSALIGGVGRDAAFIVDHLQAARSPRGEFAARSWGLPQRT